MISNGTIETNIKLFSKNRVNIELMMLLDRIRTIVARKEKTTLTINVDNTSDFLTFDFLINSNEIDPLPEKNTFNIF